MDSPLGTLVRTGQGKKRDLYFPKKTEHQTSKGRGGGDPGFEPKLPGLQVSQAKRKGQWRESDLFQEVILTHKEHLS